MKTSKFSDGTVDVYKGHRPVTAGWAIFVDGEFATSGHSLDRDRAEKTAQGNTRWLSGASLPCPDRPRGAPTVGQYQYWTKLAKKYGFATWRDWYAAAKAEQDKWAAEHIRIEVVDL